MIYVTLFWMFSSAFAGGFYTPADTAAKSREYARVSATAGKKAEELQKHSAGLAAALNRYEEGLDLLDAADSHRQHFLERRTQFNREFAVATAFVHTMLEDFDSEFSMALDRALKKHPDIKTCQALIPMGGRALPGIRSRMTENPDCKGDNLNQSLAASMDKNPQLKQAIDEILALKWPEVTQDSTPQAPHGEGAIWIPAVVFFEMLSPKTLQTFRDEDAAKREQLFDDDLSEVSLEAKRKAVAKGQAITQATREVRAQWAAPILEAMVTLNEKNKKKGLPTYSFCATPKFMGGCAGTSASTSQMNALLNDKRIQKALP